MAKEEEVGALDTIRELERREPFSPFLVVMDSGDRYLIEDPDALAMTTSRLHYYPPRSGRAVHMRLNRVTAVEGLEEEPAA